MACDNGVRRDGVCNNGAMGGTHSAAAGYGVSMARYHLSGRAAYSCPGSALFHVFGGVRSTPSRSGVPLCAHDCMTGDQSKSVLRRLGREPGLVCGKDRWWERKPSPTFRSKCTARAPSPTILPRQVNIVQGSASMIHGTRTEPGTGLEPHGFVHATKLRTSVEPAGWERSSLETQYVDTALSVLPRRDFWILLSIEHAADLSATKAWPGDHRAVCAVVLLQTDVNRCR